MLNRYQTKVQIRVLKIEIVFSLVRHVFLWFRIGYTIIFFVSVGLYNQTKVCYVFSVIDLIAHNMYFSCNNEINVFHNIVELIFYEIVA